MENDEQLVIENPEYRRHVRTGADADAYDQLARNTVCCFMVGDALRVCPTDPDSFEVDPAYNPETVGAYAESQARLSCEADGKIVQELQFTRRARFLTDLKIGRGSGVHLGQGVVATAGHVIFEDLGIGIQTNLDNFYVVFSLTDDLVQMGAKIPKSLVFKIQKVCFGQNDNFTFDRILTAQEADRPDWAIVRIKKLYAGQNHPPACNIILPKQEIADNEPTSDLWLAGHPWGTSLKISKFPGTVKALLMCSYGVTSRTLGRNTPYMYVWRHNLRINHGNSGGPLFRQDRLLGIIASGRVRADKLGSAGFRIQGGGDITLIDPVPNNLKEPTNNATRNGKWYTLVTRECNMFILYQTVAASQGVITLTVTLTGDGGASDTFDVQIPVVNHTNKTRLIIDFDASAPIGFLPCDISNMTMRWAPASPNTDDIVFDLLSIGCWYTPRDWLHAPNVRANYDVECIPEMGCVLSRFSKKDDPTGSCLIKRDPSAQLSGRDAVKFDFRTIILTLKLSHFLDVNMMKTLAIDHAGRL